MNDADIRIKDLINSAVDRELDGLRSAPPLDRSRLAEQPAPARPHLVARWSVPVLAASVAALLTVGGMLAIGFERDQRVNPPANPASPAPWATPSVSKIPDTDPEEYAEAMAGAREASEVAGISVGPVSAEDAARFKDSGLWSLTGPPPEAPEPGKSYPITVRYLAGPSDELVSIVAAELRDVASGSCPQPFRVRPGHTYLIHCQVTFLAGAVGKATFVERGPYETAVYSFDLGKPAGPSASPSFNLGQEERSIIPGRAEAAREYAKALAAAPEASKVAGVSERPATAQDSLGGETVGILDGPPVSPERGKSYPLSLLFIPSANGPPISVLTIEFEDVAAGRCPRAFRVRPAHAYTIRCQVTLRAGAVGTAYYRVTGPYGRGGSGMTISSP